MQQIFICFTENLNYALGWMVIHSLWQATAIAIVSGIIAIVGRKKSPQLRYWIHNAALFSVLMAAIVTFCVYFDFSKEMGQTVFIPEMGSAIADNAEGTQQDILNRNIETNGPLSMEGLRTYFNRNIYLIVTIWVLGVALFILKLLGGISYVYYLRSRLNFPADEYWLEMVENLAQKAGVKRSVELVESALVRSPLVVGHLKPLILFPIGAINRLNPQEVEAILAHEIAHVLRNDYVFNIIQSVIEALFYFHPAVWWISANIRSERENCCDDAAIVLCGNSMTYAKALVSVQEMAYFHSPQSRELGMAFAGQRKNQLLFRVQRILKQPQNKSNVMEKLIATSLLLVMMVALSFGGNRLNNNSLADLNATLNAPSPLASVEANANVLNKLPSENVAKKHYMKFKVNGVLDSFPVGKEVADGNYNYADNMFQAKLTVKGNAVVKLNINGSEIPAMEIKNHAGFINKIVMRSAAPPQYDDENQPTVAQFPTLTTTTPMPTFSESNGDMFVTNSDGSQTTIAHKSENGSDAQVVTTKQKDGSFTVTRSGKNGTISETFDRFGNKITSNTIGRFPGQNTASSPRTYIGQGNNTITTYDADGTKSVITIDNDGGQLVKIYKNETELTHTIKRLNGQVYIDGRAATDSELRALGYERSGNGLQKIGGYMNLQPNQGLSYTTSSQTSGGENKDKLRADLKTWHKALTDEAVTLKRKGVDVMTKVTPTLNEAGKELSRDNANIADLRSVKSKLNSVKTYLQNVNGSNDTDAEQSSDKYQEVKEQINDLREEITECACQTNKDFRTKLVKKLDNLKTVLNKNLSIRELQKIESQYDMIQQEWESGECDENKSTSNRSNSNGYSYGYGNSYADAERARKDAETASQDAQRARQKAQSIVKSGDTKPDLMQLFFKNLLNRRLVSPDVKSRVEFSNTQLRINGRVMDNETFNDVKNDFERHLTNKKAPYSIAYSGILTGVTATGLSIQGTLSTSIND